MSLLDRVRALLGDDAVEIAGGADAVPRVAPASPDAVALLRGTRREEGRRGRIEGAGSWLPADAPADLAPTTRRLDKIPAIEPQDLSATAEAGIGCDLLRQQLADRGTWLALDPPGLAGRTLGSVVATATAGPLRHGFGAVRPPARRHLRHRRRAPGAERRACDEERRGVRSHQARRGRLRGVRRDRAGAPAAPRPATGRPDARARGVARGPDPGGR